MTERRTIDLSSDVYALNRIMEFDHVIRVHPDGTVSDETDVHAPELRDERLETSEGRWTLMTGYTGQYGYDGPTMHPSEFIGGRMAEDILETPGLYVALVDYPADDPDDEPSGWSVATIAGTPAEHKAYDLGTEHGRNAAQWWEQDALGGRTLGSTDGYARWILTGLDDGDPAILDALPSADLSGQWADGVTRDDIARHCDVDDGDVRNDDPDDLADIAELIDELCDIYESAFGGAVTREIERMCRAVLPSGDNWTDHLA